jgi:lipoate-protein ligase A
MLCITHDITDPYFNIASEEYLLKNFHDDIFMLYRNEPSIIIGKHQNTFAEINYWYVKEKGIKVVRRLSGGGTVFHDLGNLNFTFIRTGQEGNLVDFKRFTQPILETLLSLGIPAEHGGRNDLLIKGQKISGNAEHVYKNRTLHHGTLLFSSQLNDLSETLKVNAGKYHDKSVKSIRSKVTNINLHLSSAVSLEGLINAIVERVLNNNPKAIQYSFNQDDVQNIRQLTDAKYSVWEWNFGYSPRFSFTNNGQIGNNHYEIILDVEKGIILETTMKVNGAILPKFSEALTGVYYREDVVVPKLLSIGEPAALIGLFF